MKKIAGIVLVVVFVISNAFIAPLINGVSQKKENDPPFYKVASNWADSVLQTLTLEEKIAQMLMVAAYSNKDSVHEKEIEELVKKYNIGGLIFMQGGPIRQAQLYNKYQELSKVPLMVSIDGEWGLAMRLDSTIKYPWQMTLGAIQDNQLIYDMGIQIGEQCKRLGIQVNFAPVVDVNVNPKNPIINARSFGENKFNVAQKGISYMKGMQSVNVLANAKHFPGHGDTDADSHKSLPVINHSKERMDSIELYPFKQLIENELASMMVAHLYIPTYENTPNTATTLSKNVVTHLLQDSLGFKGLIFTDALNMKGVSKYFEPGIVDVKALLAGNDVLLFSEDVRTAIEQIKQAVENNEISESEINRRCLKILTAKEWAGLSKDTQIKLEGLSKDLNKKEYQLLNKRLFEKALTVLRNENDLIPLQRLDTLRIASLAIGDGDYEVFQSSLGLYDDVESFNAKEITEDNYVTWLETMRNYNTVLVSLHNSDKNPWKSYKIDNKTKELIEAFNQLDMKVVLIDFMNPYSLIGWKGAEEVDVLIEAYQNNKYTHLAAAELVFGGIGANGKLPVTVSKKYKAGTGIVLEPNGRFAYVEPEELSIDEKDLFKIDSIALNGIKEGAYPGCQVFAAKDGKVFYNKSFGYHTYDSLITVQNSDIYDLASVTKISASLLALMQLQDENRFSLDKNLCDYLSDLIPDTSDYFNLKLREILAHQAGLQAWVPFYLKTIRNNELDPIIYSKDSSNFYPFRVANNIYINQFYPDIIYKRILKGPIKEKEYKYSDIGYYFMQKIVEKQSGQSLDNYVKCVYNQLGMTTTGYLPRKQFSLDRIPPTENDKIFRKQIIHGDVHDPGAAMLGGVGGHAGLFSNANDLAKLMQMYLNKGTYAGELFIKDTTLNEYTKCQFCDEGKENRRAAGFDKPFLQGFGGPTCDGISQNSFGHSGFTGTMAWVDPDTGVVYVFLSNRTYPDAENKKLLKMNIRTDIQKAIYDAINKPKNAIN
ncbi:MAG: serine hydrolase [Flavobacteriales bacterium]|nr:serine hydrolase [Flavobacteriales bacterium]